MAKCDLCSHDCKAMSLVQLLNGYQAAGVVDICPDCEKWANKIKSDMLSEIGPRMRAAIVERKGLPQPLQRRWWERAWLSFGA